MLSKQLDAHDGNTKQRTTVTKTSPTTPKISARVTFLILLVLLSYDVHPTAILFPRAQSRQQGMASRVT